MKMTVLKILITLDASSFMNKLMQNLRRAKVIPEPERHRILRGTEMEQVGFSQSTNNTQ